MDIFEIIEETANISNMSGGLVFLDKKSKKLNKKTMHLYIEKMIVIITDIVVIIQRNENTKKLSKKACNSLGTCDIL